MIRVFPRRTRATPTDPLAYVGSPDMFAEADAVHISVAFTRDLPAAERLAREWRYVAPVSIGGPATGQRGEEFAPGKYLKPGYVITSRGCPNCCWFCAAWRREGPTREYAIRDGWNVLDDNLLACSDTHVNAVFDMLARQKHPAEFTGGLEAARLKPWHVARLRSLHPKQLFFAYDGPEDRDPLHEAGRLLLEAGFTRESHRLRAYVLMGYKGDTMDKASARLSDCIEAGFMPMAMLYRDEGWEPGEEWKRFRRRWSRPAIMASRSGALDD